MDCEIAEYDYKRVNINKSRNPKKIGLRNPKKIGLYYLYIYYLFFIYIRQKINMLIIILIKTNKVINLT